MTNETFVQWQALGATCAKRLAAKTNAANANQFAAESVSKQLEYSLRSLDEFIKLQRRCGVDCYTSG